MRVNIGEIKVKRKVNIGGIKMGVKKVYPELEDLEVIPTYILNVTDNNSISISENILIIE